MRQCRNKLIKVLYENGNRYAYSVILNHILNEIATFEKHCDTFQHRGSDMSLFAIDLMVKNKFIKCIK